MVDLRNILFLILNTFVLLGNSKADTCIYHDSCLCQINENDKIDISSLSDNIKPPLYLLDTYIDDSKNSLYTYTFLGCRDKNFNSTEDNKPHNIAGTLILTITTTIGNDTKTKDRVIGTANQTEFSKIDNKYLITYVNSTNFTSQPTIYLMCDSFNNPFLKIIDYTNHTLLLSSPTLCIQTEHHGMSGGSVFLWILFVSAAIYLIGGAILLYCVRGARGVEMIPNIDFWRNLPGLVKDGLIFLLSGCKPNFVTTAESYDRI